MVTTYAPGLALSLSTGSKTVTLVSSRVIGPKRRSFNVTPATCNESAMLLWNRSLA